MLQKLAAASAAGQPAKKQNKKLDCSEQCQMYGQLALVDGPPKIAQ